MKTYMNGQQLKLVGKAWEIRHYLRIMIDQGGNDLLLSDYLAASSNGTEIGKVPKVV